jgi:hypothetical protein
MTKIAMPDGIIRHYSQKGAENQARADIYQSKPPST